MSGLPSADGIQSLRLTLDRLAAIQEEAEPLRQVVTDYQARLKALKEEADALAARVPKMLQGMDVAAPGNFGWEARIVWALRELAAQYRAASPSGVLSPPNGGNA